MRTLALNVGMWDKGCGREWKKKHKMAFLNFDICNFIIKTFIFKKKMKKRTVSKEKMIISGLQIQPKHVDTDERHKMVSTEVCILSAKVIKKRFCQFH